MAVNVVSSATDKDSPYSTYTKISDIAGSLGQQFTSGRGTKGEKIAGAITSALTGLAKIKDLKGGKLFTNNKKGKLDTISALNNNITTGAGDQRIDPTKDYFFGTMQT